jgi:hypothetical protein
MTNDMSNHMTSDMSNDWYDSIAARVREQLDDDEEGSVCVLFLDDRGEPAVGVALPPNEHIGEAELDGLIHIIDEIDPPAVAVAIPRDDGLPMASDWRLWQELRARLAASRAEFIDLVVVGASSWWAAGRPDRAA